MKFIELEQGTLDWYLYRFEHRNASEAGAIMGCSPFQSRNQLWLEKQAKKVGGTNAAMAHGNNMEETARKKVSEILGVDLKPVVAEEGEYSASLDGYADDEGKTYKVEIKCPFKGQDSDTWHQVMSERIPEHYKWQMVHQSHVVPTTHTYFFVYIDEDTWDLQGFSPSKEDTTSLLEAWDDFYNNPPMQEITDPDLAEAIVKHKSIKTQIKELEARAKDLETKLEEEVSMDSVCGNTKITWVERKGNVNYSSIGALEGVNLDEYRAKSTRYMKIDHGRSK